MAPRFISLTLAAACAAAALLLANAAGQAKHLQAAENAGARGDFVKSMHDAGEVQSEPALTRAYVVRAYAAIGLSDLPDASRWFRLAVRKRPDDWQLHRDWAIVLSQLGETKASRGQLKLARRLNPRLSRSTA